MALVVARHMDIHIHKVGSHRRDSRALERQHNYFVHLPGMRDSPHNSEYLDKVDTEYMGSMVVGIDYHCFVVAIDRELLDMDCPVPVVVQVADRVDMLGESQVPRLDVQQDCHLHVPDKRVLDKSQLFEEV